MCLCPLSIHQCYLPEQVECGKFTSLCVLSFSCICLSLASQYIFENVRHGYVFFFNCSQLPSKKVFSQWSTVTIEIHN